MKIAGMTVVTKAGARYCANAITSTIRNGDAHAMLTFVSSGQSISLPAEEVERIEYGVEQGHCDFCDQTLPNLLQS